MLDRDWFDGFFCGLKDAPMDVWEDDKGFGIDVDLPGVALADIEVSVSGDKLSIKADRKWAKPKGWAAFRRPFSEIVLLPENVDSGAITATCSNGVLKVSIPKRPAAVARKVEVKAP
jgi:HSP20 family protein